MARALSDDLRIRVLKASATGMSARQAAGRFGVGVSTAIRWSARAVEGEQLDELERRIESNPEIVLAAIHQGRVGSGGTLPSYIDNPQTRGELCFLIERR